MITNIINLFKNLDKKTFSIMKKGITFSFIVTIISSLILLTYILLIKQPQLYYIGLALLKLSLFFIIDFIICGIVVENIKKQII